MSPMLFPITGTSANGVPPSLPPSTFNPSPANPLPSILIIHQHCWSNSLVVFPWYPLTQSCPHTPSSRSHPHSFFSHVKAISEYSISPIHPLCNPFHLFLHLYQKYHPHHYFITLLFHSFLTHYMYIFCNYNFHCKLLSLLCYIPSPCLRCIWSWEDNAILIPLLTLIFTLPFIILAHPLPVCPSLLSSLL